MNVTQYEVLNSVARFAGRVGLNGKEVAVLVAICSQLDTRKNYKVVLSKQQIRNMSSLGADAVSGGIKGLQERDLIVYTCRRYSRMDVNVDKIINLCKKENIKDGR